MASSKADNVRITPLRGGKEAGGCSTLVEIGGARLLCDIGWERSSDLSGIRNLAQDLQAAGGVDAVLLSHADLQHVGGVPIVLGHSGLQDIPLLCTYPVNKFAQLLLYDSVLNENMEAHLEKEAFSLDDVDIAFSNLKTVKYSQPIEIPDTRGIGFGEHRQIVSVKALPSGRTVGGTIWRITCGPVELLYAMDLNLKRDTVLEACNLDQLPVSPALMIVEGSCVSRGLTTTATTKRARKDKEEIATLLTTILDTLRDGGNVIIPCETAGRTLELLQILSKHWTESKLGMYHLIFMSHMSRNIMELARCQLEWMSDSLNRDFYNGKANPFELPLIKLLSSTQQLDKRCPGPKVMLATDATLDRGLAKELLLRYGGDPRTKVIYVDTPEAGSLAATLKEMAARPPIIVNLSRAVKTPLTGQELVDYRIEQEKKRKMQEEEAFRQRRQEELAEQLEQQGLLDEDDTTTAATDGDAHLSGQKRSISNGNAGNSSGFREALVKRLKSSVIAKYLQARQERPGFFERKINTSRTMDEYGLDNDDLNLHDMQATESKFVTRDRASLKARFGNTSVLTAQPDSASSRNGQANGNKLENGNSENEVPSKLVAVSAPVQFTCDFKEFNISGRVDMKAMKALINKVKPVRLLVIRGMESDCDQLIDFAKSISIEAIAPKNRRSFAFQVRTERLKLLIPRSLVPSNVQAVRMPGESSSAMATASGGGCTICVLEGQVMVADNIMIEGQEGSRIVRYVGKVVPEGRGLSTAMEVVGVDEDKGGDDSEDSVDEGNAFPKDENSLGVVSMGEVTLNTLKQVLEAAGIKTDFRIGATGGLLVCAEQVIIRKDGNNFSIDGPPIKAYFEARKALYQQFAFL